MTERHAFIVIIIIIVACLLMMISAAFMLSGDKDSEEPNKRTRSIPDREKAASRDGPVRPLEPISPSRPFSEKPLTTSGLRKKERSAEEYAAYVKEYLETRMHTTIRISGLRRYYSESRGIECVDFTYSIVSGVTPSEFKASLNDMDTALSNVSGQDTITFHTESGPDTLYRTIFYLKSD